MRMAIRIFPNISDDFESTNNNCGIETKPSSSKETIVLVGNTEPRRAVSSDKPAPSCRLGSYIYPVEIEHRVFKN